MRTRLFRIGGRTTANTSQFLHPERYMSRMPPSGELSTPSARMMSLTWLPFSSVVRRVTAPQIQQEEIQYNVSCVTSRTPRLVPNVPPPTSPSTPWKLASEHQFTNGEDPIFGDEVPALRPRQPHSYGHKNVQLQPYNGSKLTFLIGAFSFLPCPGWLSATCKNSKVCKHVIGTIAFRSIR